MSESHFTNISFQGRFEMEEENDFIEWAMTSTSQDIASMSWLHTPHSKKLSMYHYTFPPRPGWN